VKVLQKDHGMECTGRWISGADVPASNKRSYNDIEDELEIRVKRHHAQFHSDPWITEQNIEHIWFHPFANGEIHTPNHGNFSIGLSDQDTLKLQFLTPEDSHKAFVSHSEPEIFPFSSILAMNQGVQHPAQDQFTETNTIRSPIKPQFNGFCDIDMTNISAIYDPTIAVDHQTSTSIYSSYVQGEDTEMYS
jgi:hypothetical protein